MGLFVTDEERYAELENYYKIPYDDNSIKTFMKGNEDKVRFVKDNYSTIIDYLKKEYPDDIGSNIYYTNTEKVDDRKIAVLATDATFFPGAKKDQFCFPDKEHFISGLEKLINIGDSVTWSKEKYVKNFPAILTYLEKHDGIDVAEVRNLYSNEVEEKKRNPTYQKCGELAILDPGPSVETKLINLIKEAKKSELEKNSGSGNYEDIHKQAIKYLRLGALREVLKQQENMLGLKQRKEGRNS